MVGTGEARARVSSSYGDSATLVIYSSDQKSSYPAVQCPPNYNASAYVYVQLDYGGEIASAIAAFNWGGK